MNPRIEHSHQPAQNTAFCGFPHRDFSRNGQASPISGIRGTHRVGPFGEAEISSGLLTGWRPIPDGVGMPIYEFACPKCRRIYSFLSKRINPSHSPSCPKCGRKNLSREISRFALIKGAPEPKAAAPDDGTGEAPMPDLDDPRVARAMSEMERDMEHMDENNPKHMAHMLRKMKDLMPAGTIPKEFDVAIKRLEAGEDPEKIEADMGDVLGDFMGGEGGPGGGGGYTHDEGLYDY